MRHPVRSIAGALVSVALVLGVGACSDAPLPTEQVGPDGPLPKNTSVKYTFTGVTLVDGDLVVENGIIEAGVRDHKKDKNDWTSCTYFTEDWTESLGVYGENAAPGPGDVEAFCANHFPDRQ